MSIFRSLFDRKPDPTPGSLAKTYLDRLGLTRQEALALEHLKGMDGWSSLMKALDSVISLRAEEMLTIDASETLHMYRGRIIGLREVPDLVDEIVARLKDLEIQDERSRKQNHLRDDPAVVATFGTPAWDSTR